MIGNWKIWIAMLSISLLFPPASGVEVSKVELHPKILLPGDFAEGRLILTAQNEDVKSLSFKAIGIEISPKFITEIGVIAKGTSYELPFKVKGGDPGVYSVEVLINTKNDSKKHIFNVEVADDKPVIVLKQTRLTLNEVNEIEFIIASRINFERVMVKPLFDSEPSVFYFISIEGASGSLMLYPTKKEPLSFKISYYNGRNHHETIQEVEVKYESSKGVFLSQNLSFSVLPVNDVSALSISISNLRKDRIYGVTVEVSGEGVSFSENRREIAYLDPFSSTTVSFLFSPEEAGDHEIDVKVSYKDEMGNSYTTRREVEFRATNQEVLGISNLEIKKNFEEVKITGDLSNGGRSKVRNVLIEIISENLTKNFFVGELDAGDFFSFDFSMPPAVEGGLIRVTWANELGNTKAITTDFKVSESVVKRTPNTMLYVGIAAVIVAGIIATAILKSRK
jgi:hypothetical protein